MKLIVAVFLCRQFQRQFLHFVFMLSLLLLFIVTSKGDHWLSQRYSELHLNTLSKPLRWLSKKCRRQDLNLQPQQPLPGLIPSLMLQTARFYARLYYHAQTWAHNLLRQKVITDWVSAIVSYILTFMIFVHYLSFFLFLHLVYAV